jgi:hypothetical protein
MTKEAAYVGELAHRVGPVLAPDRRDRRCCGHSACPFDPSKMTHLCHSVVNLVALHIGGFFPTI